MVCEKKLDGEVKTVAIWGDVVGIKVEGGEDGVEI